MKKVALNAVKNPRPVRAPQGGIMFEGYVYDPGEIIPPLVIQHADPEERNHLFNLIEQDRKERASRKPAPGQQDLPGIEREISEETDEEKRAKARIAAHRFAPPNVIPDSDKDEDIYENMYHWMMNHYEDWYKSLSSDQEHQATWDRDVKISEMNRYLLKKKNGEYNHSGDGIAEGIRVFDSLSDEAPPLDEDTMVFRGVSNPKPETYGGFQKGVVFPINTYMSTSIDPRVAANFMGGSQDKLMMRIHLPKGTRVAAVTPQQIHKHRTSLSSFVSSPYSYEQELTLPRDSQFRVVSHPHEERFTRSDGSEYGTYRVMDLEMIPQPTPEESPELPHQPIPNFETGSSRGFDENYDDDDDDDPWEGEDPDYMKQDKIGDLEKMIEEYEENPGHDADALNEIHQVKEKLEDIEHIDYGNPDEFTHAMNKMIKEAQEIIDEAPDHTPELWENYHREDEEGISEKQRDIKEYTESIDNLIKDFKNHHHDFDHPIIAQVLSDLNLIRKEIQDWSDENLEDHYYFPEGFTDDLDKTLTRAQDIADMGHALYQEEISGNPPLFADQNTQKDRLKKWMKTKKLVDGYISQIREFDSDLADRVHAMWDKVTHELPGLYSTDTLMNQIENMAANLAKGSSPDYPGSGYGLNLPNLERKIHYEIMKHKSIQENIKRAEASGVFQGKFPESGTLAHYAKQDFLSKYSEKLFEFQKYLDSYRKKKESTGEEINPDAGKIQKLWDLATKELEPTQATLYTLGDMIRFAKWLKDGEPDYYYKPKIEHIENDLNKKIMIHGSPEAKLEAKKNKMNSDYINAMTEYQDSPHVDQTIPADFAQKFHDYIKSKGIDDIKHIDKLPSEVQNQIFSHAEKIIDNIKKAAQGSIHPTEVWETPAEDIEATKKKIQSLKHDVNKSRLLKDFANTMFKYGGTPHYDPDSHKEINNLMAKALEQYQGHPNELAVISDVVNHAKELLENKPIFEFPENPEKDTKSFSDSYKMAGDVINKLHDYEKLPHYNPKFTESVLDRFNMLADKWKEEPKDKKDDIHYLGQLVHIYYDIHNEATKHADKLNKIGHHADAIEPELTYKNAAKELWSKLPGYFNQYHLDMYHYLNSPHFDPKYHHALVGDYNSISGEYSHDQDLGRAKQDFESLLERTKSAVTNNGEHPHEKFHPEPEHAQEPVEKIDPPRKKPPRLNYERIARHIIYSRNQAALKERRVMYAEVPPPEAGPLDLSPKVHESEQLEPQNQRYFNKIHRWQMIHYGNFLKTMTEPEQRMLNFDRPVQISMMNRYIKGKMKSTPSETLKGTIHSAINTMEGVINRSPPLKHDLFVYRGLRSLGPHDIPEPGSVFHDPGFQSTSLSANVSGGTFSKNRAVLRIRVPQGTRLAPVSAFQILHHDMDPKDPGFKEMEHELLLGRGHHIRISKKPHYDLDTDLHVVDAELLPHGHPMARGSFSEKLGNWLVQRHQPGVTT